jgi:hypothetical protein
VNNFMADRNRILEILAKNPTRPTELLDKLEYYTRNTRVYEAVLGELLDNGEVEYGYDGLLRRSKIQEDVKS